MRIAPFSLQEIFDFLSYCCKEKGYIRKCVILLDFSVIMTTLFILPCFSSLRMLVEKPPITGKEITSLSASAMAGFRLTPGAVPEPYRYF